MGMTRVKFLSPQLRASGARLKPPGHAEPPGFRRGHLPQSDRGRQGGDGARRHPQWRQGGIEEQTRKLFEGCRLRDAPILTFVNKLDREGRDPFDLIDDIEQSLALDVIPASWPIGMGAIFSAPMTSSPMRCCCSNAGSTTGSSSRSGAAASTIRNCRGCRNPRSPNRARRRKPSPIMCDEPPAPTFRVLCPMMPGGSNDAE